MKTKSLSLNNLKRIKTLPQIDLSGMEKFFKPEEMPLVDASPVGRHRLLQALRNKFGASFRNVRGVSSMLKDYDSQVKMIKNLYKALE